MSFLSSNRPARGALKLKTLSLAIAASLPAWAMADEAAETFNTTFLQGSQSSVDLQQLL